MKRHNIDREVILNVAWELFLKYGYKKTNLRMIVKNTGGSLATIYKIFKNKKTIFSEALYNNGQVFIDSLEQEFFNNISNDDSRTPEQYFQQIGRLLVCELLSAKNITFLRLILVESYDNPELFEMFNVITVKRTRHFLLKSLDYYNAKYHLNIKDTEKSIEVFMNLIVHPYLFNSILQKNYQFPTNDEIEASVNRAKKL